MSDIIKPNVSTVTVTHDKLTDLITVVGSENDPDQSLALLMRAQFMILGTVVRLPPPAAVSARRRGDKKPDA